MTVRDELAQLIATTAYPAVDVDEITDAVLAAGYTKPQTVTTVEELDALPDDSVIRTCQTFPEVFQVFHGRWSTPGVETDGPSSSVSLPAVVLFSPANP